MNDTDKLMNYLNGDPTHMREMLRIVVGICIKCMWVGAAVGLGVGLIVGMIFL